MMTIPAQTRSIRPLLAGLAVCGLASTAQAVEIDDELALGLDFRALEYQRCFELPECDLGDVIVKAQIRQDSQADWTAGLLYWDPIDGFGVLGGGQDDEIDFNERIVVTFNTLKAVEKVWLTDLFVGESERYSSIQERVAAEDDFEFAMIEFRDGEEVSNLLEVSGLSELPIAEFNDIYTEFFQTGGDIHYRLIVWETDAAIVVPDTNGETGQQTFQTFSLGEIDSEKLALFADDGEEFAYDLNEVFPDGAAVNLYEEGSINARNIAAAIGNNEQLTGLQKNAEAGRTLGDVTNGEVGVVLEVPPLVTELTFYSVVGTSNDYSVAGIIYADPGL